MKCGAMIAVMAIAMLMGGCGDDASPPRHDDTITGRVVDADGLPVAGAAIVLQLETDGLPFGAADKPRNGIRFDLPEGGLATVWVGSYCDADTVRMLIDHEDLQTGQYMIIWDGLDDEGRVAPDGVYWFHVALPDTAFQTAFPQLRLGYADLAAGTAVAAPGTSDLRGAFTLSQACLPFGHTFTSTDESGTPTGTMSITRQVRVWALHPGHAAAASDLVTIDADTGAHVTITLGP